MDILTYEISSNDIAEMMKLLSSLRILHLCWIERANPVGAGLTRDAGNPVYPKTGVR
jgi:hypothetical protein